MSKKPSDSSFDLITSVPANNILNVVDLDTLETKRITADNLALTARTTDLSATGTPTAGDTIQTVLGKLHNAASSFSFSSQVSGIGSETGQVANGDTLLEALAKINDRLPLSGGTLTGPLTGTGGIIEQRNGGNAQEYQLYETDDGTKTDYVRAYQRWSGYDLQVGIEDGGAEAGNAGYLLIGNSRFTGISRFGTSGSYGQIKDDASYTKFDRSNTTTGIMLFGGSGSGLTGAQLRLYGPAQATVGGQWRLFGTRTADVPTQACVLAGADAWASASTNTNGGDVHIDGGAKVGAGTDGNVHLCSNRGKLSVFDATPQSQAAYNASPSTTDLRDILINFGFMAAS